jgi:hypothetical protein
LGVITNGLYKAFRVDEEQWKLSVMALFNRSEPVLWELMQLEGTENWRCFVRRACTIGAPVVFLVQFVLKVQLNREAEGEGQSRHHGSGRRKIHSSRGEFQSYTRGTSVPCVKLKATHLTNRCCGQHVHTVSVAWCKSTRAGITMVVASGTAH